MEGYNVLIPSACQQTSPELTLPVMDALQALGHVPVVMDMASMAEMYKTMRYEQRGCYEIFGFYAREMMRESKIDFGISIGLGMILEDPVKAEAHNLLEESGLPSLIYLHLRGQDALEKLESIEAHNWHHTFFVCSTQSLAGALRERGFQLVEHAPPGASARLFFPQDRIPANAAFPVRRDEDWAVNGYEVSFAGSFSPFREKLLSALADDGVKLAIFGDLAWKKSAKLQPFFRNSVRYMQDLNTVYNHSKINLDLPVTDEHEGDYISGRLFDCLASGNFMLTHARPALGSCFEIEHELATYETGRNGDAATQLRISVQYYLTQEVDRIAVANRGYRCVMSKHLWQHRLERLLPRIEMHLLQTAVR